MPPEDNTPNVPTLTVELIDNLLQQLLEDPSEVGQSAVQFIRDKKDVLTGLAPKPLVNLLQSLGDDNHSDRLDAQVAFVDSLPSAAMVNEFYTASVESLEASVNDTLRLGSILKSIANYAAGVAPKLLGILTALI